MARIFYTLVFILLLPVFVVFLWFKGRTNPEWRKRFAERFGIIEHPPAPHGVWIHAASVGEVQAALPMVQAFQKLHPNLPITITTFTPTGGDAVRRAFGESVTHLYLPFDIPGAVHLFLRKVRPGMLVIMERELWPNLLAACERVRLPVLLANARMSEKSARVYKILGPLTRQMMQRLTLVAVQDVTDGKRYLELGLPEFRLEVTGSVKFDVAIPSDVEKVASELRSQWGDKRRVLALASSHADEDERLLDMYPHLLNACPDLLLLLVPRHPERFDEVAAAARTRQLRVLRRTSGGNASADVQVYVADTMGEMLRILACADLVLMGGSLIERGGHNPIEPAALGKATLIGPHYFNFAEIVARLERVGALLVVPDEQQALQDELARLLPDTVRLTNMGNAAKKVVKENRGAVGRLISHCEKLLNLSAR